MSQGFGEDNARPLRVPFLLFVSCARCARLRCAGAGEALEARETVPRWDGGAASRCDVDWDCSCWLCKDQGGEGRRSGLLHEQHLQAVGPTVRDYDTDEDLPPQDWQRHALGAQVLEEGTWVGSSEESSEEPRFRFQLAHLLLASYTLSALPSTRVEHGFTVSGSAPLRLHPGLSGRKGG